ncbi:MAG: PilN domain-containing protein, partial [Gammaproteobacteria bacterium]|nr:PilN domain-containing protein [Gammaproteobacteria bacterium]
KEKKRLLARMEVIQQLQRNRPSIVHLFEEMVNVIPEGAHIKSLKQSGKSLTIEGIAQSNARVSAYMRNIDSSPWLTKPQLNIIEKKGQKKKDGGRDFILRAEQLAQSKKEIKK